MYGLSAIMMSLYFLQHYYYTFWYGNTFASENTYSWWGLAELLNVLGLLIQHVPAALIWITACTNTWPLVKAFISWTRAMQYFAGLRFIVVNLSRAIGLFADYITDINSYDALSMTYSISL